MCRVELHARSIFFIGLKAESAQKMQSAEFVWAVKWHKRLFNGDLTQPSHLCLELLIFLQQNLSHDNQLFTDSTSQMTD